MTYLLASDLPRESAGKRFRALMERPEILQLPGAHNGIAALQAKAAGFDALYLSGAGMSATMGLPDLGVITAEDVTFFIRQIVGAAGLPLLVDGDTGYGGVLNVMNMVRTFEAAGAGAVHIEDQVLPKKCGQLNGKHLIDPNEMAAKVAGAVKARRDLIVIARTDAAAVEGVDGAVARAKLYAAAGRRCDLRRGVDQQGHVSGSRNQASRHPAACEHDGVRRHSRPDRRRVQGARLWHDHLAGFRAARGQ
jgi:methylisocitrate lyase